jgi:phage shock protein E
MNLFQFWKGPDWESQLRSARNTQGAVILDVRTAEEYAAGHIPGAVNLPLDQLERFRHPKDLPVYVYCRSGGRSSMASAALKQKGYRVINLGGILSYRGVLE